MATKLKRVFNDKRRLEGFPQLILPPPNVEGKDLPELKEKIGGLSSDALVWDAAARKVASRMEEAGGLEEYVKLLPSLGEPPVKGLDVPLYGGLGLSPHRIGFRSGLIGFDLALRGTVLGRVSIDPSFDANPHFGGAELFMTVTPKIQGLGLSQAFMEYGERLLCGMGFGYAVLLPGHPASCVDAVKRGYRPLPRSERSKALFGGDGSVGFSVDTEKEGEVNSIIAEASEIAGPRRRREAYAARLAPALFSRASWEGGTEYIPQYYFIKKLREPSSATGLDAEVLRGRRLTWEEYSDEAEKKKRLTDGSRIEPDEFARNVLRERLLGGREF